MIWFDMIKIYDSEFIWYDDMIYGIGSVSGDQSIWWSLWLNRKKTGVMV